MPEHAAAVRPRHAGTRAGDAPADGPAPNRWWSSFALPAGVLVLLLGVAATALDGGLLGSPPAPFPGADTVRAVDSTDGRLRSRMIVHQGTTATVLVFEVHLRDRTWLAPDERLVRLVVRDLPRYGAHASLGLPPGTAPNHEHEHEHTDRTPVGPEGMAGTPARQDSFAYRSVIVAAATLPGAATGFTYFTATLDVTGLVPGDYVATVELLDRWAAPSWNRDQEREIDRVTHLYTAF